MPPPLSRAIGMEIKRCVIERMKEEQASGDSFFSIVIFLIDIHPLNMQRSLYKCVFSFPLQRTSNKRRWRFLASPWFPSQQESSPQILTLTCRQSFLLNKLAFNCVKWPWTFCAVPFHVFEF